MQPPVTPPPGYATPSAAPTPPAARAEASLRRSLFWAATFGALGSLSVAVSVLLLGYFVLMAVLAGTSAAVTPGDVLATLGWGPFEITLIALSICAVPAALSMGALLVLRHVPGVRRWGPKVQGFAAAGAAYATISVAGSSLGSLGQALLGY